MKRTATVLVVLGLIVLALIVVGTLTPGIVPPYLRSLSRTQDQRRVDEMAQIINLFSNTGDWHYTAPASFTMDVKKTDSLVCPYAASISYTYARGEDYVVSFEYRNGEWALGKLLYQLRAYPGWRDPDFANPVSDRDHWKLTVQRFYEGKRTPDKYFNAGISEAERKFAPGLGKRYLIAYEAEVRTGPGLNYPLDEGNRLKSWETLYVLQERDGWIRVRPFPEDTGWSGWVPKAKTVPK